MEECPREGPLVPSYSLSLKTWKSLRSTDKQTKNLKEERLRDREKRIYIYLYISA